MPNCKYCGSEIIPGKRGLRLEQRSTCGAKECRRQHHNALNAAWRVANRESHRAQIKAWRVANADRVKAVNREWWDRNREQQYEINRAWHAANRERHRALIREWERRNPGAMSGYRAQRRGWKSAGFVATHDWLRLVQRHDYKCYYCGTKKPLTMDHIIPLSRGGKHMIGNILPACRSCNSAKNNRLLVEWRAATRCLGAARKNPVNSQH